MKSNFLLIRIFSVLAIAMLLVGSGLAQGKGRGGGGGGGKGGGGGHQGGPPQQRQQGGNPGGGGGGQQRGGGNPWGGGGQQRGGGNPWGGGGQQRQIQQAQRQQAQQWQHAQRQQQQAQRQQMQVQRQQQMQQWQNVQRQQKQWQNAQRQQVQQQRQWQNAQRDQQRAWQNSQRQQMQQQRALQNSQRQQQRQWQQVQRQQQRAFSQPRENWGQERRQQAFEAKRFRDELKSQQRADRDAWKFARRQQHFDDKAFRQAQRQYRSFDSTPYAYRQPDVWTNNNYDQPRYRDYGSYQPAYPQYYQPSYPQYYEPAYRPYDYPRLYSTYPGYVYSNGGYYFDDNYYDSYSDGRSSWIEPLFRSVIAMFFSNGIGGGYYDDYAGYQPYDQYGYGYEPQYSYYQPTYYTFGYPPTYTYYEPGAYYGYDQFAYNALPYDAFATALPYNDVRDIYSGGLAGELIQRSLGMGYYQGLLEGQLARDRGWGDQYYSDPYLYQQTIYDPYSSSIGDCRRYFSEGYEMGYQDALQGQDDFALADGGDVDLVGLLLGNVLSLRG